MALRVYVESIGCKLNQSERDTLARQFARAGWEVVLDAGVADVCVVNTCAVTQAAGRKSQQRLRSLRRLNPSARLVATGCLTGVGLRDVDPPDGCPRPHADGPTPMKHRSVWASVRVGVGHPPDGLDVDLVVPNDQKQELVLLVQAARGDWGLDPDVSSGEVLRPSIDSRLSAGVPVALCPRTRPLVKIQDGCDNDCAYCIVHTLRGRQRSRPRQDVVDEITSLVRQGYHEVVLTGVHVGSYGRDIGDSLVGLVRAILDRTSLDRLRLSSIEPWDLQGMHLWQDSRLCRHLHLPLQSGCDATLQRMNRQYTTSQYAEWVDQARAVIPGLAVTTDVIVGFPGETEDEHAASAAFVERLAFARVHVFAYSPRPGTPAAAMPDHVLPEVKQQRAAQIREIGRRSGASFRRQFLGQTLPVLWEMGRSGGRRSGLTDNYIRVFTDSDRDLANVLCPTRLIALEADGMRGEID